MLIAPMTSAAAAPPPEPLDSAEEVEARQPATAPDSGAASTAALRRSTWWWIRAAAALGTVLLAYQLVAVSAGLLGAVLNVLLYLIFGAIVAFIAGPGVDGLVRYARVPRTIAILVVLGGGLLLVGLLVYVVAGSVVSEARSLANQLPDLVSRAQSLLNRLSNNLKARNIPVNGIDLGASQKAITSRLESVLLSSITGTVTVVIDFVIIIVVAFWLLKDGERLRRGFLGMLPGQIRVNAEFGLDAVGVVIGGYVRAQLLLACVIGALAGVGCAIIGVPYPLVVAIAAGVFELIPIVGPFVGGAVAALLALTVGPGLAFATVVLFLGIHIIEGYVLAPRIQAHFVQLHPLVALLALFAGIEAGGFLGALFAVPAASLVAVFIRAAIGDWRATRPDVFAIRESGLLERRRETILGEFRLFKHPPLARARRAIGRLNRGPAGRGDRGEARPAPPGRPGAE